jgi:hypothetical protein
LATLGSAIFAETSPSRSHDLRKRFSTYTVRITIKMSLVTKCQNSKRKCHVRRLVKVENKRLILTCFETFIEANGKQLAKTNIANKVSSIRAVLLYILASVVSSLMLFAFSSPIKRFYEFYVPCYPISFYLKIFPLINAVNLKFWLPLVILRYFSCFSYCQMTISLILHL